MIYFRDTGDDFLALENENIILSGDSARQLYRSFRVAEYQKQNKSIKLTNPLNKSNFDNNLLGVKINYE